MRAQTCFCRMPSPLGELLLTGNGQALTRLYMPSQKYADPVEADWAERPELFTEVVRQLGAYFAGRLRQFELPLAPEGNDFQQRVWQELLKIPFGETRSYGEIAMALGSPGAARAVGSANGRNRISIIIPCHRVIGADGSLTGYGGGMERKRWLLEHEAPVQRHQAELF